MTKLLQRFNHIVNWIEKHLLPIKISLVLLLSAFLFFKGVLPGWNKIYSDFPNYYVASKIIAEDNDIHRLYDNNWFQGQIDEAGINAIGKFSPQPPLNAFLFLPLSGFSPITAKRSWLVFSSCLLVGIVLLLSRVFQLKILDASIAVLLLGRGLVNDLYYGQLYIVISFLILLALYLLQKKDYQILPGVLLAFTSLLKYFPIILVGQLILAKKYRLVAAAVMTIASLLVWQIYYFGWGFFQEYINSTLIPHLSGDIPGQGGFAISYQSWSSISNILFVEDSLRNPSPFINWPAGRSLLLFLVYGSIGTATWWSYKKLMESNLDQNEKHWFTLSLFILSGLVLLPATASYHMIFLMIPVGLIFTINERFFKLLMLLMVVIINFMPRIFFSSDSLWQLVLSYPRLIALSTLLLLWNTFIHKKMEKRPDA